MLRIAGVTPRKRDASVLLYAKRHERRMRQYGDRPVPFLERFQVLSAQKLTFPLAGDGREAGYPKFDSSGTLVGQKTKSRRCMQTLTTVYETTQFPLGYRTVTHMPMSSTNVRNKYTRISWRTYTNAGRNGSKKEGRSAPVVIRRYTLVTLTNALRTHSWWAL